nr:MAG TPA: hypothetical protein [Caudoviricetes sp.]DAS44978.1 MAG TPA: hypothetical protein [Caudoviricetes sp.]
MLYRSSYLIIMVKYEIVCNYEGPFNFLLV